MQFLAHESQKQIEIQQNTTYLQIVVYLHSIELKEHTGGFWQIRDSIKLHCKKNCTQILMYIYVDLNYSNLNFKDCETTTANALCNQQFDASNCT